MTRIVQLIPTLDQGGAEKQMSLVAAGLKELGFDIHVCTLTRGGPWAEFLEAHQIPVEFIEKRRKIDPQAFSRLRKYFRELRPDLVQTWLFAANAYGRWAAQKERIPHVVANERCVDEWKSGYHFWIDRLLAKKTDKIVVNSQSIANFYQQHGLPDHIFENIPNGIELLDSATVNRLNQHPIRELLGLSNDVHLITCVGRLWPQKRVRDLIWATDLVRCVREDVHLVIVGDGPQRLELEEYADKVEVLDRVHFLGNRQDAVEIIAASNLVWVASEFEGQSNVIMEAMNVETPLVVTDIPGNQDLIRHEQTGILVPVGDRAAFATWAIELLKAPEQRHSLAKQAKQFLTANFSVTQMVERYAALYKSLLNSN